MRGGDGGLITGILVGFGAANNDALAAVMVWRALTYFPQVIIGIVTYLVFKRQQAKALTHSA